MWNTFQGAFSFCRKSISNVPVPRQWMIEITNRCNLRCAMCSRHTVAFKQSDMPLSFFQRLIDRAGGIEGIWPYGFGEPMLHPDLWKMVAYAKSRRMTVSLSTNATLLRGSAVDEMLKSGLDYLILAVDGATRDVYEANRKDAAFSSVRKNIETFLELKVARKAPIHVTLQMIRLRNNAHEATRFRKMWRRPGVDCIRIREDLSIASVEKRPHAPCFFLWRGPLFVQAAGTILPCPYYHGAAPFGDLHSQNPEAAWNSARMQALRTAHVKGDLSAFPLCQQCPRYKPHPAIAALSFAASTSAVRKYLPWLERLQQLTPWTIVQ
jgi:MoaA/NifB/PqqE/SkfB family radical SAM enzyme